jgi:hypothetical protein
LVMLTAGFVPETWTRRLPSSAAKQLRKRTQKKLMDPASRYLRAEVSPSEGKATART